MNGKFCGEAWDAISRYVYTALQGGSIMQGWTNDDRMNTIRGAALCAVFAGLLLRGYKIKVKNER